MILDDLIILGRACPEPIKDGRVTVCLAGYSHRLGFIRLYPTRYDMPWKRWDIVRVEVERNERDTRYESWKIAGSKTEWESLADKVSHVGHVKSPDKRRDLITSLKDSSVSVINEARRSLGIIKPRIIRTYFRENSGYFKQFQMGLPGFTELDKTLVKRDFPFEPRIKYTCPEGDEPVKERDQQVLEWGFYEWLRKNPDKKDQVWENAGFHDPGTDLHFLVGNQAAHRNSFMIISVLRFPAGEATIPLLPLRKYTMPDED